MNFSKSQVISCVILILICIAGLIVPSLVIAGFNADADRVSSEAATVLNEAKDTEEARRSETEAVVNSVSGYDANRVRKDTSVINSMLHTMSTWKDSDSYAKARDELVSKYGIEPDGQLLSEYMPYFRPKSESEGERGLNPIDSRGLSLKLGDVEVFYRGSNGDKYSYAVKFDTYTERGAHKSGNDSVLFVTVDDSGLMSDAEAYWSRVF